MRLIIHKTYKLCFDGHKIQCETHKDKYEIEILTACCIDYIWIEDCNSNRIAECNLKSSIELKKGQKLQIDLECLTCKNMEITNTIHIGH